MKYLLILFFYTINAYGSSFLDTNDDADIAFQEFQDIEKADENEFMKSNKIKKAESKEPCQESKENLCLAENSELLYRKLNTALVSQDLKTIRQIYICSSSEQKNEIKPLILAYFRYPDLITAIKENSEEMAMLLLELRKEESDNSKLFAPLEKNDISNFTDEERHIKMSRALLEPHKINGFPSSKTAFIYAAKHGLMKLSNYLLDEGANINEKDAWGWTALMYAAAGDHSELVQRLLSQGSETFHRELWGRNARMLSEERGFHSTAKLFISSEEGESIEDNNPGNIGLQELDAFNSLELSLGDKIFLPIFILSYCGLPVYLITKCRIHHKKLRKLVKASYIHLGMLKVESLSKYNEAENILKKYYQKYISKDFNKTLTIEMVCAQLVLYNYHGRFQEFQKRNSFISIEYFSLPAQSRVQKLHQELSTSGIKTKYSFPFHELKQELTKRLFPNGNLCELTGSIQEKKK